MKSVVTIRREIARLRGMSGDMNLPPHSRGEAYEAYHALRWAIENVAWRPSTLIRKAAKAEGGGVMDLNEMSQAELQAQLKLKGHQQMCPCRFCYNLRTKLKDHKAMEAANAEGGE